MKMGLVVSGDFKSFLQPEEWHQAHYYGIIPFVVEWPSGTNTTTFKQGIRKHGDGTVEIKIARFLLSYRSTTQSSTGESPAQLRWGCSLMSHIDLLQPKVQAAQSRQKKQHGQHG